MDIAGCFETDDVIVVDGNAPVILTDHKGPVDLIVQRGIFVFHIQKAFMDLGLDMLLGILNDKIQSLDLILEGQKTHFRVRGNKDNKTTGLDLAG